MDITKMLSELRSERMQIDEAIVALERIVRVGGKRRGRPPKWLSAAQAPATAPPKAKAKARKKRVVSAEARERMAEAQKRRWALKHKQEKKEANG